MLKKMPSRHLLKSHKNNSSSVSSWDEAISDAEKMMAEAQDKVRQLAKAVRVFKRRRDNGEPFFSERAEGTEAQG